MLSLSWKSHICKDRLTLRWFPVSLCVTGGFVYSDHAVCTSLYVLRQSLQYHLQWHITLDRVIKGHDCRCMKCVDAWAVCIMLLNFMDRPHAYRPPFHYQYGLSKYGYFHYKDETVVRPSYLYDGNPYAGLILVYIETVPGKHKAGLNFGQYVFDQIFCDWLLPFLMITSKFPIVAKYVSPNNINFRALMFGKFNSWISQQSKRNTSRTVMLLYTCICNGICIDCHVSSPNRRSITETLNKI